MLRKYSILAIIMVLFWYGSALALHTDACNHDFWHDPNVVGNCIGRLQQEDMGDFNDETGAWEWNPDFVAEFGSWGHIANGDVLDWQIRYAPFKGIVIEGSSFDIKRYYDGREYSRVNGSYIDATSEPRIWRVEGPNGEQNGFFVMDLMPPQGCDPGNANWGDPNDPCNQVWIDVQFNTHGTQLEYADVVSIRWVEKDVFATIERDVETIKYGNYSKYDGNLLFNFWKYSDWEPGVTWYNKFPDGLLPEAGEIQTVEYTFANGEVHTLQYIVPDTRVMPQISIETVNKEDVARTTFKGKVIKDGLKIVWNDPPLRDIMVPGIELKVYVGRQGPWEGQQAEGDFDFLWVDVPSQMHKLLVPMDEWNSIKDALIAKGETEAVVRIIYRIRGDNPDLGTSWSNRGYSELISIPLN